jgi:ubiquinone/menaquinone biosynthesis C-methylase UbiE
MVTQSINEVLSSARKDLITEALTARDKKGIEYNLSEYMLQLVDSDIYTSYERLKDMNITTNSAVLDAGCGAGQTLIAICRHVRPKVVIGLDIEKVSLMLGKYIAKHYLDTRFRIFFLQSTICEMPFKNDSYSHVICRGVLSRYVHNERAISEISRMLRHGGKVYIRDKDFRSLLSNFFKNGRIIDLLRNSFAFVNGTIMHFTGKQLSVRIGRRLFYDSFQTKKAMRRLLSRYGIEATFIPTPRGYRGLLVIGTKL